MSRAPGTSFGKTAAVCSRLAVCWAYSWSQVGWPCGAGAADAMAAAGTVSRVNAAARAAAVRTTMVIPLGSMIIYVGEDAGVFQPVVGVAVVRKTMVIPLVSMIFYGGEDAEFSHRFVGLDVTGFGCTAGVTFSIDRVRTPTGKTIFPASTLGRHDAVTGGGPCRTRPIAT